MEKTFNPENLSTEEVKKTGIDLHLAEFTPKEAEDKDLITLEDGATVNREAHVRTRVAEIQARLANEERSFIEKILGQNKLTAMDLLHAEALIENAERSERIEMKNDEQERVRTRAAFEERRKEASKVEEANPLKKKNVA